MPKLIQIRPHAKKQLQERQIPEDLVKKVLLHPGQVIDSYSSRKIAQDIVEYKGERFLLRVVYKEMETEIRVITVYLTTKLEKYWRGKDAY